MKDSVPFLNFAPLQNALAKLRASAVAFQQRSRERVLTPADQKAVDEILYKTERALTRTEGLPRRDWFRHHVYAPGFYTGYGVKTLPGIREAIEQRDWKEAEEQIVIAARVLEGFAAEIDKATRLY
ncbi:MAG: transferrin receptor-like dimerization domain-containing protein [Pyrinomonadaceae bacterium]|nr:transferrin receptor-like dimerization domain-containing protein [Pyrinomonadaceae bacterium]